MTNQFNNHTYEQRDAMDERRIDFIPDHSIYWNLGNQYYSGENGRERSEGIRRMTFNLFFLFHLQRISLLINLPHLITRLPFLSKEPQY